MIHTGTEHFCLSPDVGEKEKHDQNPNITPAHLIRTPEPLSVHAPKHPMRSRGDAGLVLDRIRGGHNEVLLGPPSSKGLGLLVLLGNSFLVGTHRVLWVQEEIGYHGHVVTRPLRVRQRPFRMCGRLLGSQTLLVPDLQNACALPRFLKQNLVQLATGMISGKNQQYLENINPC